ncbi:MAG TPA: DUF4440 domain-containing protein [Xanthomonadaceae bacterium]|nr:DUF4440 domain-containing protein [Xanthomonadaceae bacterium]
MSFNHLLAFALFAAGSVASLTVSAADLNAADARCAVWARELSFSQSVADHDRPAFAAHVDDNAIFGAESVEPQVGRDAVLARWEGLIAGTRILLRWYPRQVVVGGSGDVAVSSGPALYEFVAPEAGQPDFMIGGFHSVWQRGADGIWRVVFDDGIEPKIAGESDIETFRSGRREDCPFK